MKYIHRAMVLFTAIVVAVAFTSVVQARDKQYDAMQISNLMLKKRNDSNIGFPVLNIGRLPSQLRETTTSRD